MQAPPGQGRQTRAPCDVRASARQPAKPPTPELTSSRIRRVPSWPRSLLIRQVDNDTPCPIHSPYFRRMGGKPQHCLIAGSVGPGWDRTTLIPAPAPPAR
jgi:hypothetical protein